GEGRCGVLTPPGDGAHQDGTESGGDGADEGLGGGFGDALALVAASAGLLGPVGRLHLVLRSGQVIAVVLLLGHCQSLLNPPTAARRGRRRSRGRRWRPPSARWPWG